MRSTAKSPARQHAEWLSLIEVSGPFLTLTVLNQHLNVGLDAHDPDLYRSVKEAFEEWDESSSPAIHTAWIRFLLAKVLGYPAQCIGEAQSIPESAVANLELQGERIRPDLAIIDPEDSQRVKLPILVYSRSQKLDSPLADSSWTASPHTRMQVLLQNTGAQAGFVTNGAQWSLVHVRKGEPTGFATWQTELLTEEKILLQAFVGILGVERTLGSPTGASLFDLLDKSAQDQEEVTKELGRQVRQAVEVFVNALDRLDQDSGRTLLASVEPQTVYNGALTVMMRLIFLLCAEERDLMDSRSLYVQHYSVSALNDQLREVASGDEQVIEHRHDAWKRLLATFRLVHGGCDHEDLNLPAYGGSLFDPAKYPFLEQAQIDNRVTLHLLDALEFLEIRVPGGGRERRRLSFRALGVEQIGHVYEGLLDHTALRAKEPVLGLTGKESEEEEIALSVLETNRQELRKFFDKQKVKVSGNPDKLLAQVPDMLAATKLRIACGTDDDLYARVVAFLNIVREDSLEHIQVYPTGSLYVTAGTDRRSSGTHYTPVSLTEEVVQYALEPQVYVGPAEGIERGAWKLKSATEIVNLKVCDMAMGSGAFLVQACRYLSERLVEAWMAAIDQAQRPLGFSTEGHFYTKRVDSDHVAKTPGTLVQTPFGNLAVADPAAELISDNPEERLAQARRIVADRCLYGVDINPMAVEMAKLSLWLTTMRRDRPFTFLDHALRQGDSLLSVTDRQLEAFNLSETGQFGDLLLPWVRERVERAAQVRKQLASIPSHDPESIYRKAQILSESDGAITEAVDAANLLLATELLPAGLLQASPNEGGHVIVGIEAITPNPEGRLLVGEFARDILDEVRFARQYSSMHWHLEFADVFADGGFDTVLGNPPFQGGQKITGALGTNYRDFVVKYVGGGKRGSADLCAYFLLKAVSLLKFGGTFGFLTTNTISQGDTREVGLDQIVEANTIYRAEKSTKWPGAANLEIAKVWVQKARWVGVSTLDGMAVSKITAFLEDGAAGNKPFRLKANEGQSFIGSYVLGMGFVLTPEEANRLLERNSKNSEVLFPYLNGEDLNSRPDHSPSRWVINFFDWPLGRVNQRLPFSGETIEEVIRASNAKRPEDWFPGTQARWMGSTSERRSNWLQLGVVPTDYPGPVASDYHDCMEIVERLVRPDRARLSGGDMTARDRATRWWRYGRRSDSLYAELREMPRCLACSVVSQYLAFEWFEPKIIFAHRCAVFPHADDAYFSLLQSCIHELWARAFSSTLESRLNYSPSDCFETFPQPTLTDAMRRTGLQLHELRSSCCDSFGVGLTDVARRFHDPNDTDALVLRCRDAIIACDLAVRDAYGWSDLEMGHGFFDERRSCRFAISPSARQEVLKRLSDLNRQRYSEELASGLHDKRGRKSAPRASALSSSKSPGDFESPRRNLFDTQLTFGEVDSA